MTVKSIVSDSKAVLRLVAALSVLGLGACASVPTSSKIALGDATIAPAGFTNFCQRMPEQCGIEPTAQREIAANAVDETGFRPQAWTQTAWLQRVSTPATGGFDWSTAFHQTSGLQASDRPDVRPALVQAKAVSNPLTPALFKRMSDINQQINRKIAPASDEQAFSRPDYWALPLTEGLGAKGNCKHYVLEKRQALLAEGIPSEAMTIAIVRTQWGEIHAVLVVDTDKGEYVLDNLSPWVTPWRETAYQWLSRQVPGHPTEWATVIN